MGGGWISYIHIGCIFCGMVLRRLSHAQVNGSSYMCHGTKKQKSGNTSTVDLTELDNAIKLDISKRLLQRSIISWLAKWSVFLVSNYLCILFAGEFIEIGRIIDNEHDESKHVQGNRSSL